MRNFSGCRFRLSVSGSAPFTGFRGVTSIVWSKVDMASRVGRERVEVRRGLALKEGFLYKKGGIIKSWTRRFFILNKQSLCYFKNELGASCESRESKSNSSAELHPMGRVFLSDIVNITTEGVEKKKAFVFALHTKKRAILLQAANSEDKERWAEAIRHTLESDKEAEKKDPFRQTLRRLKPGLKRVTLNKDPVKGVGCTIKNAAGHILVNRIIEDGPIAYTGVLRPGDEIVEIHGHAVTGLQVNEVVKIIRATPEEFLATVRPITALKKHLQSGSDGSNGGTGASHPRTQYTAVTQPAQLPSYSSNSSCSSSSSNHTAARVCTAVPVPTSTFATVVMVPPPVPPPAFILQQRQPRPQKVTISSKQSSMESLDDVGNYDDEDEGDMPPPLPVRTEDALILVDPPPSTSPHLKPAVPLKSMMHKAHSMENSLDEQPHVYEEIDSNVIQHANARKRLHYADLAELPRNLKSHTLK